MKLKVVQVPSRKPIICDQCYKIGATLLTLAQLCADKNKRTPYNKT